mmetsp:Transcript_71089/g.230786  ORF Transcript_71089/g.230786 Transcript_71089/m.230786 type:complete len:389 (-) Transcript_71089:1086-2252(-)
MCSGCAPRGLRRAVQAFGDLGGGRCLAGPDAAGAMALCGASCRHADPGGALLPALLRARGRGAARRDHRRLRRCGGSRFLGDAAASAADRARPSGPHGLGRRRHLPARRGAGQRRGGGGAAGGLRGGLAAGLRSPAIRGPRRRPRLWHLERLVRHPQRRGRPHGAASDGARRRAARPGGGAAHREGHHFGMVPILARSWTGLLAAPAAEGAVRGPRLEPRGLVLLLALLGRRRLRRLGSPGPGARGPRRGRCAARLAAGAARRGCSVGGLGAAPLAGARRHLASDELALVPGCGSVPLRGRHAASPAHGTGDGAHSAGVGGAVQAHTTEPERARHRGLPRRIGAGERPLCGRASTTGCSRGPRCPRRWRAGPRAGGARGAAWGFLHRG